MKRVPYKISSTLCPPASLVGAALIAEVLEAACEKVRLSANLRSPDDKAYHLVEAQEDEGRDLYAKLAVEMAQLIHHEAVLPERDRFVDPRDIPEGIEVTVVKAADDESLALAVIRALDRFPTARVALDGADSFRMFIPPVEPLQLLVELLSRLGKPDFPLRNLGGDNGAIVTIDGELCLPKWMMGKFVFGGLEQTRDIEAAIREKRLDTVFKPATAATAANSANSTKSTAAKSGAGFLHKDSAGTFRRREGVRLVRVEYKQHLYKLLDPAGFLAAHPEAHGDWVEFLNLSASKGAK